MEEILQNINEFPLHGLKVAVFITVGYLSVSYIGYRRTNICWKDWKVAVIFFVIFCWLYSFLVLMEGKSLASKENFESLVKLEGNLQYNDDEGLYLSLTESIPEKKINLKLNLLDDEKNLLQFKDEFVGIWRDSEFGYQLEHNGKVIYSLEQSNAKVLGTKQRAYSLQKNEGILKYDDNEGFYMIEPPQVKKKHFYILADLLDSEDNVSNYENKLVTIWQKNHVAYQLEYNGEVIYSLERSNSKVWLSVIYDLILCYIYPFSMLFPHFMLLIYWFDK